MPRRAHAALWLWLLLVPAAAQAQTFGAEPSLGKATPLAEVLANPERYAAEPVQIRGRLADVCQKKGCWTMLREGRAQVRVRFEDYGFFLPKDSIGRDALVEGVVTIKTLSEEEARHYEEESRNSDPDSVRGPRREIGFLASGVRVLPR